jgi:hypothetical protein
MTRQSRTEITVETERVLIIRRSVRAWCPQCGCEVEMLSLGEAEALTAAAGRDPSAPGPALPWHLSKNQQGSNLVCLESLRSVVGSRPRSEATS